MNAVENVLLSYVMNSLWQAPMVFVAAWIAARMMRPTGPAPEHRVWVGALLLESLLPAVSTFPWQRMHFAWPWNGATLGDSRVAVQMGAGAGLSPLRLPPLVMSVLAIVYAAITFYFVARFVWRCVRLSAMTSGSEPVMLGGAVALSCETWSGWFGIVRTVSVVSSHEVFAPVALGIANRCVMLPAGIVSRLPQNDLDTAIGHEFAHIRRNDFLKNLVYEIVALPISYHPSLWFTRQRIMETREMVCDAMAAGVRGDQEYAQSLLRLAALLLQGRQVRVPHAIGVFDANTLERRLMKLTEKKRQVSRWRVGTSVATCLALGIATAASAVTLRLGVDSQTSTDKSAPGKAAPRSIPPDVMAGNIISKVNPKYPPDAKKAGIQGTVVLDAVVSKTGHVLELKVASGPNELQQSSLDAVRLWRYKPFLLNGDPIEVKTTVRVIYSLEK